MTDNSLRNELIDWASDMAEDLGDWLCVELEHVPEKHKTLKGAHDRLWAILSRHASPVKEEHATDKGFKFKMGDQVEIRAINGLDGKFMKWEGVCLMVEGIHLSPSGEKRYYVRGHGASFAYDILESQMRLFIHKENTK